MIFHTEANMTLYPWTIQTTVMILQASHSQQARAISWWHGSETLCSFLAPNRRANDADIFLNNMNKLLNKHSNSRWCEAPWCLWDVILMLKWNPTISICKIYCCPLTKSILFILWCTLSFQISITYGWALSSGFFNMQLNSFLDGTQGPLYKPGLNLILIWVSNYIQNELWDESIYPFPFFKV